MGEETSASVVRQKANQRIKTGEIRFIKGEDKILFMIRSDYHIVCYCCIITLLRNAIVQV